MTRTYADIAWEPRDTNAVLSGSPVVSLSQTGDSMYLVCMMGVVRYSNKRDADALASSLETAARTVRQYQ